MDTPRAAPDGEGRSKPPKANSRRTLPSVEAEVEWAKVARRFKHADARANELMRKAFIEGYLRARGDG